MASDVGVGRIKSMIDRNFGEAEQEDDGEKGGTDVCDYIDKPWSQKLYRNAPNHKGMQLVTLPPRNVKIKLSKSKTG